MRQARTSICYKPFLMILTTFLVAGMAHQVLAKDKDKVNVDKMVKEMVAARDNQRQIPHLTKTYGSFSIDEAYKIQAALAKKVSNSLGPVVGYKVAYASKAAQQQFDID